MRIQLFFFVILQGNKEKRIIDDVQSFYHKSSDK